MSDELERTKPCIVIGHAALDHIYRVEEIPLKPLKVRALEHIDAGGGMAANAAAAIARLGGHVALWSRVGGDASGRAIAQALAEVGVDTTWLRTFPAARSSTAAVIVDKSGERLIVSERDHAIPMDPGWLPLDRIDSAAAVLSDMSWKEATVTAFAAARAKGVATLLDIDLGAGVLLPEVLRLTDYAVLSAGALRKFTGSATREAGLARIAEHGVRHVGVTEGAGGYYWSEGGTVIGHQPAFLIEAVDTTGAGDAFHGAFAWALAQGFESAECARIAAATAALKCRRLGARAGLPSREEVDDFLVSETGRGIGTKS